MARAKTAAVPEVSEAPAADAMSAAPSAPAAPVVKRAAKRVVKKSPAPAAKAPAVAAKKVAKAKAAKPAKVAKPAKAEKPVKAEKPQKPQKAVKPAKPAKAKLVRDSFTIPKDEYDVLDQLKARALGLEQHVRKGELLRAGIRALGEMSDRAFLAAVKAVPTLKTGRPKSAE